MSILQQPIFITTFSSLAATTKREERITPVELAECIRVTAAAEKAALPSLKLATFGDKRTEKGSLRHDRNLRGVTGIEADYDAGLMSFDAARQLLEMRGVAAVLYTSPSHTAEVPRWRVLCPLSRPKESRERARILGRLNGLFGGIFAAESWTLSQPFYFGSVRNNPSHKVALVEGQAIDLHSDLDATWIGKPGTLSTADTADSGAGDARDDAELVRRIVTGEGWHLELCALSGRYLARGMACAAAAAVLRGLMFAWPEASRDARWQDRVGSVSDLVKSAETKYRNDTSEARREVARLIAAMARANRPVDVVRAAAYAEAARHGLPQTVADEIAGWLARRARARTVGGRYGQ